MNAIEKEVKAAYDEIVYIKPRSLFGIYDEPSGTTMGTLVNLDVVKSGVKRTETAAVNAVESLRQTLQKVSGPEGIALAMRKHVANDGVEWKLRTVIEAARLQNDHLNSLVSFNDQLKQADTVLTNIKEVLLNARPQMQRRGTSAMWTKLLWMYDKSLARDYLESFAAMKPSEIALEVLKLLNFSPKVWKAALQKVVAEYKSDVRARLEKTYDSGEESTHRLHVAREVLTDMQKIIAEKTPYFKDMPVGAHGVDDLLGECSKDLLKDDRMTTDFLAQPVEDRLNEIEKAVYRTDEQPLTRPETLVTFLNELQQVAFVFSGFTTKTAAPPLESKALEAVCEKEIELTKGLNSTAERLHRLLRKIALTLHGPEIADVTLMISGLKRMADLHIASASLDRRLSDSSDLIDIGERLSSALTRGEHHLERMEYTNGFCSLLPYHGRLPGNVFHR
eukprot:GHVU01148604.1.p1 GENE.GHVU01148604.1~~GHVU01148604.1.p1  ORF type:complete len:449 (-),score=45.44 GHVU01148604.1:318-1664(-)